MSSASASASASHQPSPSSSRKSQPQPSRSPITVLGDGDEQGDDDDGFVDEEIFYADEKGFPAHMIPELFTQPPPVRDALVTETSKVQDKTVDVCLPYLTGERDDHFVYNPHGVASLDSEKHTKFLHKSLGRLPGGFVAADASRPWFLYWALSGLTLLGEDVSSYRQAVIESARSFQNEQGGFGGGGKQTSHLATTYATVLSIALVGGEDAYDVIDRKALWRWLCSLKQPDGGFRVCVGGEEDIRYLNVPRLIAWLSSRQYAPEGGFSGRTNKLVDGCYSHWVGACFPLIEACLSPAYAGLASSDPAAVATHKLPPAPETLFSREGLIRYILCCCQDETKRGGLRDKPGKMSDAYHSNYVLCGLSSAQHLWTLSLPLEEPAVPVPPSPEPVANPPEWSFIPLYVEEDKGSSATTTLFNQADRVRPVHPAYALPQEVIEAVRGYFFIGKEGVF